MCEFCDACKVVVGHWLVVQFDAIEKERLGWQLGRIGDFKRILIWCRRRSDFDLAADIQNLCGYVPLDFRLVEGHRPLITAG